MTGMIKLPGHDLSLLYNRMRGEKKRLNHPHYYFWGKKKNLSLHTEDYTSAQKKIFNPFIVMNNQGAGHKQSIYERVNNCVWKDDHLP